jgi:hypothetical protein
MLQATVRGTNDDDDDDDDVVVVVVVVVVVGGDDNVDDTKDKDAVALGSEMIGTGASVVSAIISPSPIFNDPTSCC